MSKIQELLQRMADAWNSDEYCSDYFLGAIHALEAIPECYHSDVLHALFKEEKHEQETEQPEDYLAVKTFNSGTIQVGDEITDGDVKAVVTSICSPRIYYVRYDGMVSFYDGFTVWRRTGRNFPAIAAILDELGK